MIDFSDLDQKDLNVASAKSAPKTFPCQSCAGTGSYNRHNRFESTVCFACNGRGHHNKPHFEALADKKARKAKIAVNRANKITDIKELLEEQAPGLFQFMAENQDWNSFFADMVAQINGGKAMSANQQAAAVRSMDKTMAKRAEKAAAKAAEAKALAVAVDLGAIHRMFDVARESGLKRLCYRANGLVLTPAKEGSRNEGGIYVKTKGGDYLGKVMGTSFMACREATSEHKAALDAIATDPAGEAIRYGRETGNCCCCGKELTDPASIAAGIGPICAEKWGF